MQASILAIEYFLPEKVISNQDLAVEFPEWPVEKIQSKTGIAERHVVAEDECASDLAAAACQKLFASGICSPGEIDYLLLCTQSPDYFLPTTACLLQDRLGIPTSAGALDFNLGCSGFVYGLGLAQGLIQTGQASKLLLVTAETYTKFIHPRDRSVRTLFGDAAAATLLAAAPGPADLRGSYVFGTDGSGAKNLIVPAGGLRRRHAPETSEARSDANGGARSEESLFMDGAEIFNFTLRAIPACIAQLLDRSGKDLEQVDLFVFHQANRYMLDHLRGKLKIPREKFYLWLESCGNTVSSTIPIALKHALAEGRLRPGQTVMLVGFGVGYSWGATLLEWPMLGLRNAQVAEKEPAVFSSNSL
ncbi:MAG TPA: ketoacyl-ACP synthase III [Bryobacteraceae bacterium]|nr:ketoacyl-ACP synthase III [Bryobacteraceae bacterium]